MADKYVSGRGTKTTGLGVEEWCAMNIDGMDAPMDPVGHGIPLKYAALLFTGWRRRHDRAVGGLYEGVAHSADGGCAVFDIRSLLSHAYGEIQCKYGEGSSAHSRCSIERCSARAALTRAGGKDSCGIMPMAPVAALRRTAALRQFSYDFLHQSDERFNDDYAIASTMIALQTVLYLLGKASGPGAARSLTRVCRALFARVHDLCDIYPASQAIVNRLRDDPFAEDMLQKAMSGILARRPLTQVERLRIVETILKRTYKHHASLLEGSSPSQGLFAVLSIAPVMVAHGMGIIPEDKAVEQIGNRISRLPALLAEARAGGLRGDGILLHGLASESGLAGSTPYAFARLSSWCREREPRTGALANLRASADFGSFGFVGYAPVVGSSGGGYAAAFPKLAAWIEERLEAAEAPMEPFPCREGVPLKYAAVLLTGWRRGTGTSSATASAGAGAGAAGGSYDAATCHEDGSIAVFDIRSLLHHLQGNAYCPVTDAWAQAPGSETDGASDGLDGPYEGAAACGGAGAAPTAPSTAAAAAAGAAGAAGRCGAHCAARLAVERMTCPLDCAARLAVERITCPLDYLGTFPLAPAGALARSGALASLARTMLHEPCSSAKDAEAQAREAAQHGVAAAVLTLQMLLRQMQGASNPRVLQSLLRTIQALVLSTQDLCATSPAAQAVANRMRDAAHAEDVLQRAIFAILTRRPVTQADRLRMVEDILKRTYAAGFHSILDEGAAMCTGTPAAAAAAAAEAAATAASGARWGSSTHGGARGGSYPRSSAARGGAGSASSRLHQKEAPAAPTVYSAYAAITLAPTLIAFVSGSLPEEDVLTRLLSGEEHLQAIVSEAKTKGLSAEGFFLHSLASMSSLPGTSTFAFSRLADWCKARGARGELANLRVDASLSGLGFRS